MTLGMLIPLHYESHSLIQVLQDLRPKAWNLNPNQYLQSEIMYQSP